MNGFDYKRNTGIGRLCLELSLKLFKKMDMNTIETVCRELFEQWRELLRYSTGCAVLIWSADGSELMEYTGNLADEFEWCKYQGNANPHEDNKILETGYKSIANCPLHYIDKPPRITYGDLKNIVSALKRIGKEITGLTIEVGTTFDPGPEFAKSEFKYNKHTEIVTGNTMGEKRWVHCTVSLKGDKSCYASFPDGIPEGTHFGTFLGRQTKMFVKDIGFNFIWFSNGFGYSRDSWSCLGEVFDGEKFDYGKAFEVRRKIIEFWDRFTTEAEGIRIETRGSNLSTGMDIAAHASPVCEIYDGNYNITAPPNSPWAALNSNYGLELVGYMSHIAHLPPNGYLFRYYIHDPWWVNSPWFDRYAREPHDIYMPLAVARIDENGYITAPVGINLFTVDDSYGNMPRRCPIEVTPHILAAYDDYSDAPGIITWIYPFSKYHRMCFGDRQRNNEAFFGDWFICGAINKGLPLNTVVSEENFIKSYHKRPGLYSHSILVSPVPDAGSEMEEILIEAVQEGCNVFLYGPVTYASERMRNLIGVRLSSPIEGDLKIEYLLSEGSNILDLFSDKLRHNALRSGGGINTIEDGKVLVAASVYREKECRAYATFNKQPFINGGSIAWVRGSFSYEIGCKKDLLPFPHDPQQYFPSEYLMRIMLELFHYSIKIEKLDTSVREPLILASSCRNGMYLSGYVPNTTVKIKLNFPDGAPLMTGTEAIIESDGAYIPISKWWHKECRIFVRQAHTSIVTCKVIPSLCPGIEHRLRITGLTKANIVFYPEPDTDVKITVDDIRANANTNIDFRLDDNGKKYILDNIDGVLQISWGKRRNSSNCNNFKV